MNGKLILGFVLMLVGLVLSVAGIVGVGERDVRETPAAQVVENAEESSMVWPLVAGLSLAAGAALVGIGMGRFRRPKIVHSGSPQEAEAVTTTGVVHDEAGRSAPANTDGRRHPARRRSG
jgi:hypothetical protein